MTGHNRDLNKADISYVCGGSDTGKSTWVKRRTKKAARALAWDVKNEYCRAGFTPVYNAAALVLAIKQKRGRIAFVPPVVNQSWFNFFCRCAFSWYGCTVIADELADVTTPSKAPTWWGIILRRGRDQGLTVYGITNRPAESDKTIIGNWTLIHCCQLLRAADRAYMSREMGCDQSRLDALKPFDFLEVDRRGAIVAGRVTFKN